MGDGFGSKQSLRPPAANDSDQPEAAIKWPSRLCSDCRCSWLQRFLTVTDPYWPGLRGNQRSASGLPANLTIDPATGIISGTPTAEGTSRVTVTVTDDAHQVKSASFGIVIDPLDLTIPADGQALPAGRVQACSARILVAGGVPPYSFTLSGALPDGLTLDPVTGAITDTPWCEAADALPILPKENEPLRRHLRRPGGSFFVCTALKNHPVGWLACFSSDVCEFGQSQPLQLEWSIRSNSTHQEWALVLLHWGQAAC